MIENKKGRPIGTVGITERRTVKTLRELITPEQYAQVIQSLIDIAMTGAKHSDRINAAKIIIDRLEGKLPETILHQIQNNLTIDDILPRDSNE